uniref:NAD(P)-binding protein n=1 Tax=Lotharella globosa TaxID=91324 RepID=A0A6U2YXS5_9EUKA|mmetsp:Transcript_8774/g.17110  ORF Transcript_8774/g.17110 Transcript_8774/m.17110 type:complete len:293 (+) Transcript_8774:188-1066(+)|eukprot:CAMPEP_0167785130 /NCGR_PEP_ID=MMETSP0111_2-20121227/8069_1 /TAXON_ID=91324 /ORGANISM="Lotharella globosa, Strain CCCM811" /LENGTH=292 /DNA_ID=CAMNT_0007676373 /DNA_START=152 /DNA_END=1030 /DNA_ORIENTATION=+
MSETKNTKRDATGDVAVITGGGSGIGQATTLNLLGRGCTVVVMDYNKKALEATSALADKLPGKFVGVAGDIRSEESRNAVADAVKKTGQPLRMLIHNAGVNTPCKMMMDLKPAEWMRVMDINMNGPLYLTQTLYPLFGKENPEKNRILFLTTIAKMCTGLPNYGPYCVSKLGAEGVAKMLKEELPKGKVPVYTGTLIPGEVNTGMQEATAYSASSGFPEHLVKHWRMLHETKQLLPPPVAGAFIAFVMLDTTKEEFGADKDWFVYDNWHHARWATEFKDVKIVEPRGLAGEH